MARPEDIRKEFPALSSTVYGKPWIYLDNAATSQRPVSVMRKQERMNALLCSNIHRAVHRVAVDATEEFEKAREAVRRLINAPSTENIVFTSGTTASINLVAYSYGEAFVNEGDEIVVCEAEHHSNLVPWQLLCSRKGAVLKVLPVDEYGAIDLAALGKLLGEKTALVAVAQVSNVLGLENPVKEIVSICHSHGVPVLVDGAQGIVHQRVDVQDTDCDFYVFSGHKLYAATGTGVLYGKTGLLDRMPPFLAGGEMIETVTLSGTTFNRLPYKFEAGTQNLSAVPTFVEAVEFQERILADSGLAAAQEEISAYVYEALSSNPRIRLFGVPRGTIRKCPIFSFVAEGAHHEDLALILDKMGVAVRSGQMCAEPLMDRFGVTGMVRASFAPYNTMGEAEAFIGALDKALRMLS